jgi:hypothetical protein
MSKFFLLLVAGLVTQAGAVEPSQSAPLCSPEHRAWLASRMPWWVRWYDDECENLLRLQASDDPLGVYRWEYAMQNALLVAEASGLRLDGNYWIAAER